MVIGRFLSQEDCDNIGFTKNTSEIAILSLITK